MFAIAFDNNLNKILLDSLLTVCLKNGRMLKNSLKTDPHFAILFGGTSCVEMTFPLFIYIALLTIQIVSKQIYSIK